MLEISELAKSFGSRVLWEGLNWTFMREGMTAVVVRVARENRHC